MRSRVLDGPRRRAIALARGVVLEIGVGAGPNLALYGPAVERVCAIDPSAELLRRAGRRSVGRRFRCRSARASAECCPLPTRVFDNGRDNLDAVLDADPALARPKRRRVLSRAGDWFSSSTGWRRSGGGALAARADAVRRHIAGGCHLDRSIDELIRAPFPDRHSRRWVYHGAEAVDFFLSGVGDGVMRRAAARFAFAEPVRTNAFRSADAIR